MTAVNGLRVRVSVGVCVCQWKCTGTAVPLSLGVKGSTIHTRDKYKRKYRWQLAAAALQWPEARQIAAAHTENIMLIYMQKKGRIARGPLALHACIRWKRTHCTLHVLHNIMMGSTNERLTMGEFGHRVRFVYAFMPRENGIQISHINRNLCVQCSTALSQCWLAGCCCATHRIAIIAVGSIVLMMLGVTNIPVLECNVFFSTISENESFVCTKRLIPSPVMDDFELHETFAKICENMRKGESTNALL